MWPLLTRRGLVQKVSPMALSRIEGLPGRGPATSDHFLQLSDVQSVRHTFWEESPKGFLKYEQWGEDEWAKKSYLERYKDGIKSLKGETLMLKEEWKEKMRMDPKLYEPGDTEYIWRFNDEEQFKSFRTACDSDWKEGFSTCSWSRSKAGFGLFQGFLDTEKLPMDGKIKKVGWVNLSSPKLRRSFFREDDYNWEMFTHLVMRVRGDGRTYALILRLTGHFDVHWFDVFNFGLYTHGGPYWQYVKIPFSRFFLSGKGRIQDAQNQIELNSVKSFGISLMDNKTGPFSLEIDYIGAQWDPSHEEEFAYEMYYTPDYKYRNP